MAGPDGVVLFSQYVGPKSKQMIIIHVYDFTLCK